MPVTTRQIYLFLSACGGNWRNTIYISCPSCRKGPGFLMAIDRDGKPVIVSIKQFQGAIEEMIDPTECRGHLDRSAFSDIYSRYLLWRLPAESTCMICKLL